MGPPERIDVGSKKGPLNAEIGMEDGVIQESIWSMEVLNLVDSSWYLFQVDSKYTVTGIQLHVFSTQLHQLTIIGL